MGAENSVLQKFELGEPYSYGDSAGRSGSVDDLKCTIFPAVRRKDGKPVTLLKLGRQKEVELCKEEVLIEVLKTIRHPNIIKFLDVFECSRSYWLITEEAVPLAQLIENLEDDELICGLFDVMKSLIFLHSRCRMTHNNLKLSAVFVSTSGRVWKLGAMEKVCSIKKSPELVSEDIKMFAKFAISVLDMVQEPDFAVRNLAKKLDTEIFQSTSPLNIEHIEALLDEDVFRNPFMEISTFLDDITLKTKDEKDRFFESLYSRLQTMNQEVLIKRLAPQLFSAFVLAEPAAEAHFLQYLFKYKPDTNGVCDHCVFRGKGFREFCLPIIMDLLRSRDTHVRLVLLKFLPAYMDAFTSEELHNEVLSEVLIGLKDLSDDIVAATFRALSYLVPVLGGEVVVGGNRCKHFVDRKPKFDRLSDGSCSEDKQSDVSSGSILSSPSSAADDQALKSLERKKQREIARQERAKIKEKSPSRSLLGVEKIKKTIEKAKGEGRDSEPEWEEYEASSAPSEEEYNEPPQNTKERPTATVQPVVNHKAQPRVEKADVKFNESETPGRESRGYTKPQGTAMMLRRATPESETPSQNIEEESANIDEEPWDDVDEFADNDFSWTDQFDPMESESENSPGNSNSPQHNPTSESLLLEKQNLRPNSAQENRSPKSSLKPSKLGSEFEVEVKISKHKELDFFADMEPEFKAAPAALVKPQIGDVSASKFSVMSNAVNEEAAAGWEEDGWDDFG